MPAENKPVLYLRADGNNKIGHGHVIRTLAVGDMLKNEFVLIFLIQQPGTWLLEEIKMVCDDCIELPVTDDLNAEAEMIGTNILHKEDIIILDGYHFTNGYQKKIRESNCRMLCIDDIHDTHFLSDVLINHAGGVSPADYSAEAFTKFALGPAYALVRRQFRQAATEERVIRSIDKIFICFGGADITHVAFGTVETCLAIDWIKELHVVSNDPLFDQIPQHWNESSKGIFIYKSLNEEKMAALMQKCQVAICPASTLSYEVCTTGMGFITGMHADNQESISGFLSSSGCAKNVGDFRKDNKKLLHLTIEQFNTELANQQIAQQRKHFGNSEPQIKKIFRQLQLQSEMTIRKALAGDVQLYYEWATDPVVRKNAIDGRQFDFDQHSAWFKKKLQDPDAWLYVFNWRDRPVGQLRFEYENGRYLIDYSIGKEFRGNGFGDVILQLAIKRLTEETGTKPQLYAHVKVGNEASAKAFKSNTFALTGTKRIADTDYEIYQK